MIKRMAKAPEGKIKKRVIRVSALVCALLIAALSVFYAQVDSGWEVAAQKRELPVYSVDRDDNRIAISFDAAWGGDKTEKILDILDEYGVKTTFFVVDIWVQRFPDLVKEIAARGHEIGNHSTSHPHMSKLSESKIKEELKGAADSIEALTGVRPTLFRPPYGDYNNLVVSVARAQGYECIQWSVDSLDWKNRGAQEIIDRTTKNIHGGDIVLFHNDSQYSVQALPEVLESYKTQGLTVVPVSELLLEGDTYVDTQGRQKQTTTQAPEGR